MEEWDAEVVKSIIEGLLAMGPAHDNGAEAA
jgi:hypothetical protein